MFCFILTDTTRPLTRAVDPPPTLLQVIIMSATLSTGLFSEYFGCTVLTASGRMHPVEQVVLALHMLEGPDAGTHPEYLRLVDLKSVNIHCQR